MDPQGYISSLVHRVTQKDVVAMRTLYEKYSKEMLATSYRITNDLQTSEDILQESFLDSFEKIRQLKERSKYGGWLKRIVINRSLGKVKKKMQFPEVALSIDIAEEEELSCEYSFAEINQAIQSLPDGCRQVFSFFLLDNYKHKEIAEMLNISISTSKSQYRYALKLLRKQLIKT